jgi:hypothetical protein
LPRPASNGFWTDSNSSFLSTLFSHFFIYCAFSLLFRIILLSYLVNMESMMVLLHWMYHCLTSIDIVINFKSFKTGSWVAVIRSPSIRILEQNELSTRIYLDLSGNYYEFWHFIPYSCVLNHWKEKLCSPIDKIIQNFGIYLVSESGWHKQQMGRSQNRPSTDKIRSLFPHSWFHTHLSLHIFVSECVSYQFVLV